MLKAKEDLRQFFKENKTEIIGLFCAISIIALHSKRHSRKIINNYMKTARPIIECLGNGKYQLCILGDNGQNFAITLLQK